jgi:hypothetical protein
MDRLRGFSRWVQKELAVKHRGDGENEVRNNGPISNLSHWNLMVF